MRALGTAWAGLLLGVSLYGLPPAVGADDRAASLFGQPWPYRIRGLEILPIHVDQGTVVPRAEQNGSPAAPFDSIARAVRSAPSDDTIAIRSGIYAERLVLSKPVRLIAAEGPVTVRFPAVIYVGRDEAGLNLEEEGSAKAPFGSIMQAVDASAKGGAVALEAGSYAERLVLSKRVTLVARNGLVEIYAPSLPVCPASRVLVWNRSIPGWECRLPLPYQDVANTLAVSRSEGAKAETTLDMTLAELDRIVSARVAFIEKTGLTENSNWLDLTLLRLKALHCEPGDRALSYRTCERDDPDEPTGYVELVCKKYDEDGNGHLWWVESGQCVAE